MTDINMDINNNNMLSIYKSYNTTLNNVKNYLEEYGVAVIPNILNNEELNSMRTGMWDYIEYKTYYLQTPIDRNNINTWDTWYSLKPYKDMLLKNINIGQSQFIWDIRQNLNVVNVFATIWNVKPTELFTSFDAISFHLPPEITNKGWYDNEDWFHVDSSYLREEPDCFQSFVTAYDINEGDSTLSLLEGSHKYHQDVKNEFNISNDTDWYTLNKKQLKFYYDKQCIRTNVIAPAGSIVLWDSRTVHCGMTPLKTRKEPNLRLVSYICMTPKSFVTEEVIKTRIYGFENMYTSSHCPHRPTFFPTISKHYTHDMTFPISVKPILNDLGKSLVGYL